MQKTQFKSLRLAELDNLELFAARDSSAVFPLHAHETACISIIEKGVFAENGLLAAPGSICFTPPDWAHENRSLDAAAGCSFTTFYLSPDLLGRLGGGGEKARLGNAVIDDPRLFESLRRISNATAFENEKLDENHFFETIEQLFQSLKKLNAPTEPFENHPKALLEALDFVEKNGTSKISLDQIARAAGMDRFKFDRFFKRHVGLAPFAYVALRRLEAAKKSLRAGDPIVHAALDAGFFDQAHFSKCFKKYVGVTPGAYAASLG